MFKIKYTRSRGYGIAPGFLQGVLGEPSTDGTFAINIGGSEPQPQGLHAFTTAPTELWRVRAQSYITISPFSTAIVDDRLFGFYCTSNSPASLRAYAGRIGPLDPSIFNYAGRITLDTAIPSPGSPGTGISFILPRDGSSFYLSDCYSAEVGFILAVTRTLPSQGSRFRARFVAGLAGSLKSQPQHPSWVDTPLNWTTSTVTLETVYGSVPLNREIVDPYIDSETPLPYELFLDQPFVYRVCVLI